MATNRRPILIIGAGISGLTLAQACRKENIPYRIFERDQSSKSTSAGWGLTLNWSLPIFRSLLPESILARLPETYVNRVSVDAGEKGSFTFFDLSTAVAKWKVPAAERIRVSRLRLRSLLLTGLDVEWEKTLTDFKIGEEEVEAGFSDGTTASGSLVVACDGANSAARRVIRPSDFENFQLPARFIGATVKYSEDQVKDILALDHYFFQGSDPRTDAYLWFSFLDCPGDGASASPVMNEKTYRCQVMVSWPYREGFFGRADPSNVPNTDVGQFSWMKTLSAEWAEPFRSLVHNIPRDSEFKPIELTDYVPKNTSADAPFNGRAVLLGDAAHAMVMFRGDGAQQSIADVSVLLEHIRPLYAVTSKASDDLFKQATREYENEIVERTQVAVLASRQACLDAHDWKRLDEKSPLVRRRVMRADLDLVENREG